MGAAPSAEISRGRVVMAQAGILSDQVLAGLEARFGAVQLLPRSLDAATVTNLIGQLRELDSAGPKALLIVDSAAAQQFQSGLEQFDPAGTLPLALVRIPAGSLPSDADAVLAWLLNILTRADSIPGRHSAGLEAAFTLQAERQALFISTGT